MATRCILGIRTRTHLRQIEYWKNKGLTLEQIAAKTGLSFHTVKSLWGKYLAIPREEEEFDEENVLGDCVTKIVIQARKKGENTQPYLYFIQNYHVRASTAMKICEQLRGENEQ